MIIFEKEWPEGRGLLHYCAKRKGLSSNLHLHDSFELVFVTDGSILATVDGQEYTARAGQALLLFPGCIHRYKTHRFSESYVLIFPAALIGEYYEKHRKTPPVCPLFDFDGSILPESILAAAEQRWQLKSLLYRVVDLFDRQAEYSPHRRQSQSLPGQILSAIADGFDTPLTLHGIAQALGYDHRYLAAVLQKELHTTFRTLLNEYRISHAQALLLRTALPIERIAGECGYDSICSFNRNFKALTGTTPTAYRKG
jgi:AraC-like DNA-binding protein